MKDPIVEETRKFREQYASQFNHDIDAIYDDIQQRQVQSGKKTGVIAASFFPSLDKEGWRVSAGVVRLQANTMQLHNVQALKPRRKELRSAMTPAEIRL